MHPTWSLFGTGSLKGYLGSSNSGNGPDLVVKSLANINLVEDHVDLGNH